MKSSKQQAMELAWHTYMEVVASFTLKQAKFEVACHEFRSWATYGSYSDTSDGMRDVENLKSEAEAALIAFREFQEADEAFKAKGKS